MDDLRQAIAVLEAKEPKENKQENKKENGKEKIRLRRAKVGIQRKRRNQKRN